MKHKEYKLQRRVCTYLKVKYPNVFFLSDAISNVRLTPQQQQRNKAIQNRDFHCPDLLIIQPNEEFNGLFIELKIATPFKKNGEIKASSKDHLKNQLDTINRLKSMGYNASFQWDYDEIVKLIDDYMKKV